jgi:cytoskeleton protein RodZ
MGAAMAISERPGVDLGATLRRAREARKLSLQQIAAITKISVGVLEALERNDISRLPGGIFSRAFVRAYASEIGLDPDETVRDFLTQFPHDSVTAGSPHVPLEDNEAIESTRQSAETAVKLFAVSLPIIGAILYFTLGSASC